MFIVYHDFILEDGMKKTEFQVNKKFYDTELKNPGVNNIIKLALVFKYNDLGGHRL